MYPPRLFRLLFVATVVAGVSAPMLGASAAPRKSSVDTYNMPKGFFVLGAQQSNRLEIDPNDTVGWNIIEGEHTITPKDPKQWGDDGSDTLNGDSAQYVATHFRTPGADYFYYCKIHGSPDGIGKPDSMWGVIHVKDIAPTTTSSSAPPTTQPTTATTQPTTATTQPTTVTTRPGATPPATTATAPTTRPAPAAPAPTTTTAKGEKDKKQKEETTTTVPALTPPPPVDLPDEAIIPTLPGASTTSSAEPGANAEAPADTPEGQAVALLKSKNNGDGALKLLIVSGIGLGALGIGSAGYKYANRSSKYFPA